MIRPRRHRIGKVLRVDEHLAANRTLWDHLTPIHAASAVYDVESFKRGRCTLHPIELEELGDVRGKRLLHLQCHFGLDTLSWARRGALATGADFSPAAIDLAKSLACELGIAARFVCADLYDLPDSLDGRFDIVFTSAGVLPWLPDLQRWGQVIARFLVSGGVFYIREAHPVAYIFDDTSGTTAPKVALPYFRPEQPLRFDGGGDYADPDARHNLTSYEWPHSMAEIINSLIGAGLRIDFLHEFPYGSYRSHPFLTSDEGGRWRYAERPDSLPLMFSLRATRE